MTYNEITYNVRRRKARIVFSLSNVIRFPNSLLEKYGLDKKKAVKIFVEELESSWRVAFLFLDEEADESLKLSEHSGGRFVSGSSLFATLTFDAKEMKDHGKNRVFIPTLTEHEGKNMLMVELDKI